jgi:hypothetical protein
MMQCGQIERIWYEDDLFSSYRYQHAPIDETDFPTKELHPTVETETLQSQSKVTERSAIAAVSLRNVVDAILGY